MSIPTLDRADYQDMRLAVVMNGGVSLAVWIGGVTAELNRFQTPTPEGYSELLAFVATQVQADVISGTSAGGINGAFLAAARAYGSDLGPLRDLWIHKGALEELLHRTGDKEPQSLLRGEYFLAELEKAFRLLTRGTPTDPSATPIDLTLTSTLLRGVPNTLVDDFGTPIYDSNHRAFFRFRRDQDGDDFDNSNIAAQLAVGSRCTASFPIAFEPQFAECIKGTHTSNITSFPSGRYLVDGGLLDNKPLDHAINGVRQQRAQGEFRRVLCYVVPSPEMAVTDDPDSKDIPPTALSVGIASLGGIPLAQSISGQIQQIADHNRMVREVRSTRRTIASLGWKQVDSIAAQVFKAYQVRRTVSLANYIADAVSKGIAADQSDAGIGRRRKEWIVDLFLEMFDQTKSLPWIPSARPSGGKDVPSAEDWDWGAFTVENIANVVLYLLRSGIRLLPLQTQPGQAEHRAKITLREKLREASEQYVQLTRSRQDSDSQWRERGKQLRFEPSLGRKWVRECVANAGASDSTEGAGSCAHALAKLLSEASESLRTASACSNNMRAREEFSDLVKLLVFEELPLSPERILERLLNLEVVQFGFGVSSTVRGLTDQILELAEFSSDNSAEISVGLSSGKRPLGGQLAAFGGFYKRSWRAFDWTLGRLHGVERMLRIVLDPERITELCRTSADTNVVTGVLEQLERIAIPAEGLDREACRAWWRGQRQLVEQEITSLLGTNAAPEQLPATVKAVLRRFELAILREEIPMLAMTIQQDIDDRHAPRLGQEFLDRLRVLMGASSTALPILPGEVLEALWTGCDIDAETFETEMGTDHFINTLTQASVVATAVLKGKNSGLGPARRVFTFLFLPASFAHFLALSLVSESKLMVAVFAFVVAASFTIASLPFFVEKASIPETWRFGAAGILLLSLVLFVVIGSLHRRISSVSRREGKSNSRKPKDWLRG